MFSIDNRIKEDEKYWTNLIYECCKGDVANIRELKKMDVFEFFSYIEKSFQDGRKQGRTRNNRR